MKKVILMLFLFMFLLSGCAISQKFVHLPTDIEMQAYVHDQYGSATLLSSEYFEERHEFVFRDNVLGFEYYINSYINSVGLDATVFGYREVKQTNFEEKYCEAIWNQLDTSGLPDDVNIEFLSPASESFVIGYVTVASKLDAEVGLNTAKDIGGQLSSLDLRRMLTKYMLVVRDIHGNWLGRFDFDGRKIISEENANRGFFHRRAQEIMRIEDINIYDSEMLVIEEIPGLENETIVDVLGVNNSIVTVYYFYSEYKRYLIADICVMYSNGPHQYIYNITDDCSMVPYLNPYAR